MTSISFHKDNTQPQNGEVFVFGSNLSGIHGAGAARAALNYGAQLGKGCGLVGNSYALPTKDFDIETMDMERIEAHVAKFVEFTLAPRNAELKFFVTRVGCGLAGLKDSQMAPLFKGAINCSFAKEWKEYIK